MKMEPLQDKKTLMMIKLNLTQFGKYTQFEKLDNFYLVLYFFMNLCSFMKDSN